MESYTYEQLKGMTVVQLRDIAKGIQSPALEGYSTMHKEQLLPPLCKALNIHTHHAAQGAEKTRLKMQISKLKAQRDATKDPKQLALTRRAIHAMKRQLRRMAEQAT